MSKVSVVISAYNAERYVAHAMQSVLNQTYTELEVLIADDGSKDNTRRIIDEVAKTDRRVRVFHNEENIGVLSTRNKLFEHACGSFITLLDADDWLDKDKIASQLGFLRANRVEAVGVNYFRVSPTGEIKMNFSGTFKKFLRKNDIQQLPFWPPSLMVSRGLFEKVGGYEPYFRNMACYEDLYWIFDIL